jgi:hypothetical protein
MTRLLRLYPPAWRERYGAELASILEAQPPTLGDRLDLVRGAFDAHLHPELVARDADPRDVRDPEAGSVLSGVLIGLGSAAWLVGVLTMMLRPLTFGERDLSAFGLLVALAGVLYAAGIARLAWSGGLRPRIGSAVIAAFALMIPPMVWPIFVLGYWGLLISLAVVAVSRVIAGRWPGWLAIAMCVAAVIAFASSAGGTSLWLAAAMPIAMAMLAVLSLLRRLPTGQDRRLESEVAA